MHASKGNQQAIILNPRISERQKIPLSEMKITNVTKHDLRRTEVLIKKKPGSQTINLPFRDPRESQGEREGAPSVSLPLAQRKTTAGLREDLALTNAYHKVMSLHSIVLYLE